MRIVETKVFEFDELTPEAQKRAVECYRESNYQFWDARNVIENSVVPVADILGIEFAERPVRLMNGSTRDEPAIFYQVSYCQGDGASFEGRYRYKKGAFKKIKSEFSWATDLHQIAAKLQTAQKKHMYGLTANISASGRHLHENAMSCSVESDHTPSADLSEAESDILEAMRDFARWIYKQLREDIEGENEDEAVEESIRTNEYEFTEHGIKV